MLTQLQVLAVAEPTGGSIRHVAERNHDSEHSVGDLGFGRCGQELVHRSAFVGFHVTECDPVQVRNGQHGLDRPGDVAKQVSMARMENERLLVTDQELVEAKACRSDIWVNVDNRNTSAISSITGASIGSSRLSGIWL